MDSDAKYLAGYILKITGVIPRIFKDKHSNTWRIRLYRKKAYNIVRELVKIAVREPDIHLMGGLFDAEGDYTYSKKRIRFTNKDYELISLASNYLEKHGITHHIYLRRKGSNTWYVIEIYGRKTSLLLSHLDLRHPKWSRNQIINRNH